MGRSIRRKFKKIYKSLSEFGAPLFDIREETFVEKGIFFQIGVVPRRIDIITHIDGIVFEEAYKTKELIDVENLQIPFLSKEDLIKNKESTGRKKDKLDADYLKKNKNI